MCACRGRHRCDYHAELEQERLNTVRRMRSNKIQAAQQSTEAHLSDLARKLDEELSNEQWCQFMYLYEEDDLHRLLFQAGAS